MPSNGNGENPKPKRIKGRHRDKMMVKVPVSREMVAQVKGSYQQLAGVFFDKLLGALGAGIESTKESLRHQAEVARLTKQIAAQIEDHHAEVEIEDDDDQVGGGTTAVG